MLQQKPYAWRTLMMVWQMSPPLCFTCVRGLL